MVNSAAMSVIKSDVIIGRPRRKYIHIGLAALCAVIIEFILYAVFQPSPVNHLSLLFRGIAIALISLGVGIILFQIRFIANSEFLWIPRIISDSSKYELSELRHHNGNIYVGDPDGQQLVLRRKGTSDKTWNALLEILNHSASHG